MWNTIGGERVGTPIVLEISHVSDFCEFLRNIFYEIGSQCNSE